MRKYYFFVLIFYSFVSQGQNWIWAVGGQGSPIYKFGDTYPIAVDKLGNVYFVSTDSSYMAKYDSSGIFRQMIYGPPYMESVSCDSHNNVYMYGDYFAPCTIDNQKFITQIEDMLLVKYDVSGNLIWAKSSKSTFNSMVWGLENGENWPSNPVCTDKYGDIYITGEIGGTVNFGAYTVTCNKIVGGGNVFLAKYDSAGNVLWATSAKDSAPLNNTYGLSLAADNNKNVYLACGIFVAGGGTAKFGPYLVTGYGCLVKYDSIGTVMWAKGFTPAVACVTTDKWGNVYITGQLIGSATFGPFTLNSIQSGFYLVKYSPIGQVLWATCGRPATVREYTGSYSVVSDHFGNVYVSVGGASSQNLNPGNDTLLIGNDTLVQYGYDPSYILKYDSSGNFICFTSLSSGGDDYSSIAADSSGDIYVGGDFIGTPFQVGTANLSEEPGAVETGFIAKWHPCDSFGQAVILPTPPTPPASNELCNTIFVPDVFTPGGAYNNIFYVRSDCISSMDFEVFDRWGNKVFESQNINKGWDGTYNGTPMNMGTYIWVLNATLQDGSNVKRKGSVTLVR